MLISKRAIPRLATSGLVLGSAACSSSDHASPGDVAFEFCDALFYCGSVAPGVASPYLVSYDTDYATFGQCESYRNADYASFASDLDYDWGRACGDAFLDFYACYWDAYADYVCNGVAAYDACYGLFVRMDDLCGF